MKEFKVLPMQKRILEGLAKGALRISLSARQPGFVPGVIPLYRPHVVAQSKALDIHWSEIERSPPPPICSTNNDEMARLREATAALPTAMVQPERAVVWAHGPNRVEYIDPIAWGLGVPLYPIAWGFGVSL